MKTYTINIGKELHDLISELARERGVPRAAVVRKALERERKKREKAKLHDLISDITQQVKPC